MDIEIIICTHNRAQLLRKTLASLGRVTIPQQCELRVVVVDNGSTDETAEMVAHDFRTVGRARTKLVREPRLGKSYAINKGVQETSGDILVFVDDDHRVSEGFLDAVVRCVEQEPTYRCYCGRILPDWDGTEPRWVHDQERYPIRPFPIPTYDLGERHVDVKEGRFLPGAGNLIIRRQLFDQTGGFDVALGPVGHNLHGGEDIDFVLRLLRTGEPIRYIPDAIQYHYVDHARLVLKYLLKKAYLRSLASRRLVGIPDGRRFGPIPSYLLRQVGERLMKAIFTFDGNRRRHYLVRVAAGLGEIEGCRRVWVEHR
jgi:GT2 family glycosyltransferase